MTKRRLAFATPFVLVAGCKAPAPASPQEDERTRREEAPVVVSVGEPVDAAVDLHLERAAGIRDEVPKVDPNAPRDRCCMNPPIPRRPPPPRPECCVNPPRPQQVPILTTEARASDTVIRIGIGTDDGVSRDNITACVTASRNENICDPDGAVVLVRIEKRSCVGIVKLPIDLVKRRSSVRVTFR